MSLRHPMRSAAEPVASTTAPVDRLPCPCQAVGAGSAISLKREVGVDRTPGPYFCLAEWETEHACSASTTGLHVCVLPPGHYRRCQCACAFISPYS